MEHLREVVKIVEWGLKGDVTRVAAYVKQLAQKLSGEKDEQAASYLQQLLEKTVATVEASEIGNGSRLPVDGESRLALADEEMIAVGSVPIILDERITRSVEEFIRFVDKADELKAHGVGIAPSLIAVGPPGSGKTQLARHIAARLKLPLVTARADTLISSFLGSTSKNIRQLFDHVAHRHCVLFLDELDAFAKLRDDKQEMGELKRVVVSLLQNIDALDRGTVLLAATNHEHLLDPAIWRRFSFRVSLGLPSFEQRKHLLSLFGGEHGKSIDLDVGAALTEGLSGADIRNVIQTAIREAVIDGKKDLDGHSFYWRVIRTRLKEDIGSRDPTPGHVKAVHGLAPDILNGKRLADLFETSTSTISRKLHKEDET